jgi:hypothetical protein
MVEPMCVKFAVSVVIATILAATFSTSATADLNPILVIPTNYGIGADAEVRESEKNVGLDGLAQGNNRGDSDALGTRLTFNLESSAMYVKFDISQLPGSYDLGFWSGLELAVRVFVRNNDNFKIRGMNQNTMVLEDFILKVKALDPLGTYSTSQNDRVGNAYTASEYQYDWNELGITAYNAPGRQPFCVDSNICNVDGSRGSFEMDFDSNVVELGNVPMPQPADLLTLTAGDPLVYFDTNGTLKQIVFDARDNGLDTITIIMHNGHMIDMNNTAGTPAEFLGRNHLIVPKEFADDAIENGLDNSTGAYSPQLLVLSQTPTGDYNGDGAFDAADYVVWRKTGIYGQPGYNYWRANFGLSVSIGNGSASPSADALTASVPEPVTALLLALGAAFKFRRGRRFVSWVPTT